jgi:hypothetical protein
VSTFRQDIEITLDGEVFKVRSRAVDFVNAERALARDGGKVDTDQISMRFRIAYTVFRRSEPEHPAARAFGVFLDVLDDIREESLLDGDDEAANPLDPTRPVDSGD